MYESVFLQDDQHSICALWQGEKYHLVLSLWSKCSICQQTDKLHFISQLKILRDVWSWGRDGLIPLMSGGGYSSNTDATSATNRCSGLAIFGSGPDAHAWAPHFKSGHRGRIKYQVYYLYTEQSYTNTMLKSFKPNQARLYFGKSVGLITFSTPVIYGCIYILVTLIYFPLIHFLFL